MTLHPGFVRQAGAAFSLLAIGTVLGGWGSLAAQPCGKSLRQHHGPGVEPLWLAAGMVSEAKRETERLGKGRVHCRKPGPVENVAPIGVLAVQTFGKGCCFAEACRLDHPGPERRLFAAIPGRWPARRKTQCRPKV